ncbi:MAG: RsiV family protein [Eubacteriales bacterium]|nr:RsiV family protein [Eubacteriales bacterium]
MKETHLDKMKQAYESIPIPEGLEFRVRSSMEQVKQELRKEGTQPMKSNKNPHRFWKGAAVTAATVMLAMVVLVNSSVTVAKAMERIPVLGAITRVITLRTYEDSQGNMSARVDVPEVQGGGEELNQKIQEYTDTIISQYQSDVKATDGEGLMRVDLSYQVVTDSDSLFALRFNKTVIMASGAESVKIYNVDKSTGKIITLDQFFKQGSDYAAAISDNIKEQMRDQMKQDPDLTYWVDGSDVPEWDFQSVGKDSTFYVNQDGNLVIVFDEGDVAPMFMGVAEFTIPSSVTADITLPGYLQ